MIREEAHGDVVRLDCSNWRSRLIGYSVSIYRVRGVLIDCGFPALEGELRAYLTTRRPTGVAVTHHHEDHAGNVALIASLGVPMVMGDATLTAIRAPEPIGFYRRFTWGSPRPLVPTQTSFVPNDLQLIAAPGHCSDHHVVWDPVERTLFSSDLFLGVKVRVAHADENPRQLVNSLRTAAALEPRRMFDAHRGLVRDPVSALNAKADWIEEMIARIGLRIASGSTDDAIRRELFGREGFAGYFSGGHYSRTNFIRAVRRTLA
jgi:glyoxylase-like metal-dependent hydrolase (beta-lactamase superfamily II)